MLVQCYCVTCCYLLLLVVCLVCCSLYVRLLCVLFIVFALVVYAFAHLLDFYSSLRLFVYLFVYSVHLDILSDCSFNYWLSVYSFAGSFVHFDCAKY